MALNIINSQKTAVIGVMSSVHPAASRFISSGPARETIDIEGVQIGDSNVEMISKMVR